MYLQVASLLVVATVGVLGDGLGPTNGMIDLLVGCLFGNPSHLLLQVMGKTDLTEAGNFKQRKRYNHVFSNPGMRRRTGKASSTWANRPTIDGRKIS